MQHPCKTWNWTTGYLDASDNTRVCQLCFILDYDQMLDWHKQAEKLLCLKMMRAIRIEGILNTQLGSPVLQSHEPETNRCVTQQLLSIIQFIEAFSKIDCLSPPPLPHLVY